MTEEARHLIISAATLALLILALYLKSRTRQR
jgi:hypothetical protein